MHARDWFRRLWPYSGRRQADDELREELRLHVELEREAAARRRRSRRGGGAGRSPEAGQCDLDSGTHA